MNEMAGISIALSQRYGLSERKEYAGGHYLNGGKASGAISLKKGSPLKFFDLKMTDCPEQNHGHVINRQKLLADYVRNRAQPCVGPAGKNGAPG
jgi:hypothetical protein